MGIASASENVRLLAASVFIYAPLWFYAHETQKEKLALPRRKWTINPVTRVKESDKKYSRARVKKTVRKYEE